MESKSFERDSFCFVCGKENPKGMHLSFERRNKKVSANFKLEKHYQGYNSIIHGGIISLVLDEAMAHLQNENERFLTGKISVKFHNPLLAEKEVTVEAWIEKDRKRTKTTKAVMKLTDGTVIAEAEALMFVRREKKDEN